MSKDEGSARVRAEFVDSSLVILPVCMAIGL